MTTAYTSPRRKYSCRDGRFSPSPMLPGSIALSLSLSVFTINMFFRWYITRGFTRRISFAIPAQPSTIMYVMKNVAFIGIATPIVLGILQKEYTTSQVMTMPYNVNSLPHSFEKLTGRTVVRFIFIQTFSQVDCIN